MRIALFTHSTNPRGGPVHALELADALHAQGHDATILAPDTQGAGFFRSAKARQLAIPAADCPDLPTLVETRIAEIADYILDRPREDFDIWHAHDTITANALARLEHHGRIPGFVRTIHHLDTLADPRLDTWQRTGIDRADQLFAVSRHTQAETARRTGRRPALTGNGVDPLRFTPQPDETDAPLAVRLRLPPTAPAYLALGGIEARKNTTAILEAFLRIHHTRPDIRLIVRRRRQPPGPQRRPRNLSPPPRRRPRSAPQSSSPASSPTETCPPSTAAPTPSSASHAWKVSASARTKP